MVEEGIEECPDVTEEDMAFLNEMNFRSDSLPSSKKYWEDYAARMDAQELADNELSLAHDVSKESRDAGGQWTAGGNSGGASVYQQGKAQRANAHQMQQKQAKQAYVARRMEHDSKAAPGLVTAGNVNLYNRPRVQNSDGSISTVRSMSVNIGGKEVLIPTVSAIQNRVLTDEEAIAEYQQTGQHLGVFNSPQAATQYANRLHKHQEEFYQ